MSAAIDAARRMNLAHDLQWLKLGHWRRKWGGFVSPAESARFFLSSGGKRDPEAELTETLRALAQPIPAEGEAAQAQCRFPARTRWLFNTLHLSETFGFRRIPCVALSEWKAKLNPEGVSLIFASAYLNNAASMFGHTFLKFHSASAGPDGDLLNYGVSYWANTGSDGGVPFMLFGLAGGYPGTFSMNPYHETLKDYVSLEGRDIWEYRLTFSPAETEILIDHLIELQQTYFDYYFFDENCASQILEALEVARPTLVLAKKFFYWVIPAETVRVVAATPGLAQSVSFRPSLRTLFTRATEHLLPTERARIRRLVRGTDGDFENARRELAGLSPENRERDLDAALQYGDLLAFKRERVDDERMHVLRVSRAELGTAEKPDTAPEPAWWRDVFRPEAGHDSARVGLGGGEASGQGFLHVEARAAYHDLLSDPRGYLKDSHLEVMRIEARASTTKSRLGIENPRLHDVTLIDLLSAAPSDVFFTPLAWRADIGVRRLPDRDPLEPMAATVNGGVGYSFEPLDNRTLTLFAFAQGHADAGASLARGYRLGASLEAEALAKPTHWLRFLVGARARHDFAGDVGDLPSQWLKASLTLSRNLELRASLNKNGERSEREAIMFLHFML